MLSPKLKWPGKPICLPDSTLDPNSDHRTSSAHLKLDKQVADLFQNKNRLFFSFKTKTDYSSVRACFVYGQFWIF